MLKQLSISKKLALAFGLVICLMACMGTVGWLFTQAMSREFDSLYTNDLQFSDQLAKAERGVWELRFGVANYAAGSPEIRAKVRSDEGQWLKQVQDSIATYRSGDHTPAELEALRDFDQSYAEYLAAREPYFTLVDGGKLEEAAAYRAANTNRSAEASVKALSHLAELQSQNADSSQKQVWLRTRESANVLAIALIGALLGVAFTAVRMRRTILQPLEELIATATNIADSGDLEYRLDIERQDEIGKLARAFGRMVDYMNEMASISEAIAEGDLSVDVRPRSERDIMGNASHRMIEGLSSLVRSVRDSSQQVASCANEVASASEETAKVSLHAAAAIDEVTTTMHEISVNVRNMVKNTQMQASSVAETSAAIDQMVTTNLHVADTARVLLDISDRSRQEVHGGTSSMDKATGGLNRINSSIQSSGEIIDSLGNRANDIGKIIEVIDDLAEQTNLLALNAAIEAARAGEHGLGFAVVADEVRKLAEKSAQSTKEISELIQSIQKESRRAVENMDESTAFVNEGLSLGSEVGTALNKISNVVTEVYNFAQQIGTATAQQSEGSSQIAQATQRLQEITQEINSAVEEQASGAQAVANAMERMQEVIGNSSSGATELAASADEMTKMAGHLMEVIGRFKLEAEERQAIGAKPNLRALASQSAY